MFQTQNQSQMLYFDIAPVPMLILNELGEIVHSNRECQNILRFEQTSSHIDDCLSAGVWLDIKRHFSMPPVFTPPEPFSKVIKFTCSNASYSLNVSVADTSSGVTYVAALTLHSKEVAPGGVAMDRLPFGMAVVDSDGHFLDMNQAFYQLLGYREEELKTKKDFDLTYVSDANSEKPLRHNLIGRGGQQYHVDKRYIHKHGHQLWVRTFVSAVSDDVSGDMKFIISVFDIHEEKQLQDVIATSERRFRVIAENVSSVVWISGADPMRLFYVNKCYDNVWEESAESLYGDPRAFLKKIHPAERELASVTRFSSSTDSWNVNYRLLFPDGRIKHIRDSGHCVFDGNSELIYRVGTLTDITSEIVQRDNVVTMAQQLRQLVEYDSLTGIKSRHAIMNDIRETYQQFSMTGDPSMLVYIDADGFKGINDSFGHEVGDQVLVKIAEHLTSNIRDSDVAGRIGGDEFVVLLRHTAQSEVPQILERLCRDINSEGLPINIAVTLSLGEKELCSNILSAEQWLSEADQTMYHNKREKKKARSQHLSTL
ncbi:diguanylate cyclase [Enterovibrio norvegicus FF-33]|uniref:Diguanylate cyclase n=1 Tax=Enterovibrio norvegicus FF-454 TaxID=1185651 RepID=A0A1E5CCT0_9GAMM|nr:sensor domain-containing diguanylate cyclase [Enterovibrio norvegicus]OEE62952.1 diguanylate cyclase [Enterovibrio norvegicus FF-454]OEE66876.1 diguanylate cyclase [Enterovibrio norvegicus FF-33]